MCLSAHSRKLYCISPLAAAGQFHLMPSWLSMDIQACDLLDKEGCNTDLLLKSHSGER